MDRLYIGDVRFDGDGISPDGCGIEQNGISGWRDTPDDKTAYQERATGYGSFPITGLDIRRGDRIVDASLVFGRMDRTALAALSNRLGGMQDTVQPVRVVDGDDMTALAVVSFDWPRTWNVSGGKFSATLHCTDPRRYSFQSHEWYLSGSYDVGSGFDYSSPEGVDYPISYGDDGVTASNSATLTNEGNSVAYPTFTTIGDFPGGFRLQAADGSILEWSDRVSSAAPVMIDTFNHRCMILGTEYSTPLSRREWFTVPKFGSLGVSLVPLQLSTGMMRVIMHDTYM
ncbi:hypothetical protein [Bifidobacterium mongoliense]|nr:hypothetical protein [Bifidobacterium mongoliense]